MFSRRLDRARALMAEQQVDVLLLSVGADLPYFCGYEAMPLERLTMLVVPQDGDARLIIPRLEAPRVVERPDVFEVVAWDETDDPIDLALSLIGPVSVAAIGDHTWAGFLVDLMKVLPSTEFRRASEVTSPLRSVKDAAEVESLRAAAAAADRVAVELRSGDIELVGRTEAEVSAELGRRLLAEGHQRVNFAIVAAGENAASPHHEAGERLIKPGEIVLCDFGGTMANADGVGYCSDITRCVHLGEPPADLVEAYDVLFEAQAAQVAAAEVGRPCQEVDRVGRSMIAEAGFGDNFIHRTGHGIGTEAHEDPYIVEGNLLELLPGHAFSIEPGIYMPGRWGLRLEDIVVAAADGPDNLTTTDHRLAVIDV
ncbi:MAG: aminopeptidase P family protein [Acidimicrobiia bacterium]|nr:aminopeptidase P family protein [Acidimicrobiia bacterium]MYG60101.1 aminopeptidase P family protein [Acidimicrobiia bacterium]MYJ32269.1 aminopeptidase P family protein [Acidimicrobiia bacterium]